MNIAQLIEHVARKKNDKCYMTMVTRLTFILDGVCMEGFRDIYPSWPCLMQNWILFHQLHTFPQSFCWFLKSFFMKWSWDKEDSWIWTQHKIFMVQALFIIFNVIISIYYSKNWWLSEYDSFKYDELRLRLATFTKLYQLYHNDNRFQAKVPKNINHCMIYLCRSKYFNLWNYFYTFWNAY